MSRETPFGRTSPFGLVIAILGLVAVSIFLGGRYRDVTVGMEIVPKVMSRKAAALSGIRINLIKSVEAEKSAVMANTDEDSIRFAEESRRASEDAEKSRLELAELIGAYPSAPEKELLQEFDSCWSEFRKTDQQVLKFAVQNTNVKSFELSLNRKRKITAQCENALTKLQDAVQSRTFKATR